VFKKLPMPTKKQLAAMTDEEIEKNIGEARLALQEAKQLARDATEQERVFGAYEKEQKRRAKTALEIEAKEGKVPHAG
jgi:hypothetical protein